MKEAEKINEFIKRRCNYMFSAYNSNLRNSLLLFPCMGKCYFSYHGAYLKPENSYLFDAYGNGEFKISLHSAIIRVRSDSSGSIEQEICEHSVREKSLGVNMNPRITSLKMEYFVPPQVFNKVDYTYRNSATIAPIYWSSIRAYYKLSMRNINFNLV